MIYKCIWKLKLPLKFAISSDVNPQFKINDDIQIKFEIMINNYFENIQVSMEFELEEDIDFKSLSNKSISIMNQLNCAVGPEVNRFYILLCQRSRNYYQNIFNGEDFVIPHAILICNEEGIPVGGYDSYSITPLIPKETLDLVLQDSGHCS